MRVIKKPLKEPIIIIDDVEDITDCECHSCRLDRMEKKIINIHKIVDNIVKE